MEHQVFVPVPTEPLRAALADPARVARAVPGLQQDAGADPVAGRLKLRVGGHSVTYRGTARVVARADGTYAVEADATEARGTGAVKLALTLRLADTEGGTTVTVEGTADADGRVAELPPDAVHAALTRLLNRFVENLATPQEEPERESRPAPETEADHTSVFDTEIPPPSLDPAADRLSDDFADTGEPPAEAAHARRTMIGRSAEEVDHAPPRGRYAPVPAPQTVTATSALRWAAPAAALVVASAIVVSRALRKRR
ncbi:carbon monoxide dehydrogenase subunit G [Streptomyces puniciscabiei]|uniref:Carbon monoxide dehydrogenase subunit G n=1 Tax=Streptomyces puniciscabiei TaxID=164348 RepID=A0A542UEY7_9ACTN|nr:SRPBCC domain-containing protein [Streptomyces puniciscabiei]TQK97632.1 carbon monoxide dehydrogenase subunit G [Streptomyces puniciscabiei]